MRSGHVSAQVIWEPATGATVGGALPTPKAGDGERGRDKARARPDLKGRELATVLRYGMLPTPTTRDYKDSGPNVNFQKVADKSRLPGVVVIACQATGEATYLNPSFVEEMMGYPIGHTVLKPSETP
jgi:hypothetical protein